MWSSHIVALAEIASETRRLCQIRFNSPFMPSATLACCLCCKCILSINFIIIPTFTCREGFFYDGKASTLDMSNVNIHYMTKLKKICLNLILDFFSSFYVLEKVLRKLHATSHKHVGGMQFCTDLCSEVDRYKNHLRSSWESWP